MKPDWRPWWVTNSSRFIVADWRCASRILAKVDADKTAASSGALNVNAKRVMIPALALRAMREGAKC